MIDPNLLQIRKDICKQCRHKCEDYLAERVEHHNPCARCPLDVWHHIDGADCSDQIPAFVHAMCPDTALQSSEQVGGVGTELKALLAVFGIVPTPTCACDDRAAQMDRQGIEWCESNISRIVEWMAEEAKARKLPMPHIVGVQLVKAAIRNARRKLAASLVQR